MLLWLKRLFALLALSFVLAFALVVARTNPDPWSQEEISQLTKALNEAAAIGVPHGFLLKSEERKAHLELIEKVENGVVLTVVEGLEYRRVFQKILFDSQKFLSAFDTELSVLPNHAMHMNNNIQNTGIVGNHDHHDLSARANFAGLLHSLEMLGQATSAFGRIRHANAAQKDLVDLISHLGVAPHTVSVPYVAPQEQWQDYELGEIFEAMLKDFKAAQFVPVNGPAYWAAVDAALAKYALTIATVQQRVISHTTSWERRLAGRFLSMQTLAPPVDLDRPLRPRL